MSVIVRSTRCRKGCRICRYCLTTRGCRKPAQEHIRSFLRNRRWEELHNSISYLARYSHRSTRSTISVETDIRGRRVRLYRSIRRCLTPLSVIDNGRSIGRIGCRISVYRATASVSCRVPTFKYVTRANRHRRRECLAYNSGSDLTLDSRRGARSTISIKLDKA